MMIGTVVVIRHALDMGQQIRSYAHHLLTRYCPHDLSAMKNLLIIRHAKSSWDDPTLADFDRPLNNRGRRDAPHMGQHLHLHAPAPDLILSSPAVRASQTALHLAEQTGYAPQDIRYEALIYDSHTDEDSRRLLHLLHRQPDHLRTVWIVGHNPAFSHLASQISRQMIELPTAGVAWIRADIHRWAALHTGQLLHCWYPKMLPTAPDPSPKT